MKKKYVFSLVIIAIMLIAILSLGTGYGLWLSSKNPDDSNVRDIDCFRIYYENNGILEVNKIKPVLEEEGLSSSPYTVTITNICDSEREVQLRLNTIKDTTVKVDALTLNAAGNIEVKNTLYKNLETTKTSEEDVTQSKLIGKTKISPNETVRTNIRIWFDERKLPNITSDKNYYKGHIEIIDSAATIKPSIYETILKEPSSIDSKKAPNFNEIATTEEGMYSIAATNGKYYYYRGVVNNNYVKFANYIWRIVGVNPDKSIKLVLDKPATTMKYSLHTNAMDYTGFKYDYNREDVNNEITTFLENWYNNNIKNRNLDSYVVEHGFCNDSSLRTKSGHTYFGAYDRLDGETIQPSVICPVTNIDFGGTYVQKIGLLTADEVALAGAVVEENNYNYYLYNGGSFFTASPAESYGNKAYMMIVTNTGSIGIARTDETYDVRPVINIVSSLTYEGSGTQTNPYVIDVD